MREAFRVTLAVTKVDSLLRARSFGLIVQKNDHSSKSVNSFDTGPIFFDSLGEELSRNVFVVSVYAFGKKLPIAKDFLVTPKKSRFS